MAARRVALVTGSTGGLGPAVVRALSRAGWITVSNSRSTERGPGRLHVRADVSTPAGARDVVQAALARYRRLDLLVCGVGTFEETPVSEFDTTTWDRILDSNLRSAWHGAAAALPALRRSRGSIVTFAGSFGARLSGHPRYAAYQMAKTALVVFSKSLAQAEARRGVRVNVVNPGIIDTGRALPAVADRIPAGRPGSPAEVAQAVLWLASPAAAYVTGTVLDVAGGLWA